MRTDAPLVAEWCSDVWALFDFNVSDSAMQVSYPAGAEEGLQTAFMSKRFQFPSL